MKLTKIVCTIALFAICSSANAQSKSLTFGITPYGLSQSKLSLDDNKFTYDYKSIWGGNICYESQLKGLSSLTELSFVQGKFDKYDIKGAANTFNAQQNEDLLNASLTFYLGHTFNKNKRFQLPIYVGLGGSYVKGGAIHNFLGDVAAKIRFKFYFTNKLGIYAGATGKYGFGVRDDKKDGNNNSSKNTYLIGHFLGTADAGIIITL